ncbi:hydrogenase maturation protease [Streptomyces sp. N35]|uniref:hydrogenase maturation protease n=1 Tax=Streptomyces sp. N35 TaxID=2795730 RepID=UPI0018F6F935|nr:hydrogenase maturation protease [Streptomyces sp. N35]
MKERTRIAAIGVGNEFRRDDAVGWATIARLRERAESRPLPPGTVLATCDGDPVRLISLWEGTDLAVIVDAAHTHPGSPGRVHRIAMEADLLERPSATSSHGLGLGEAVELARVLGRLPGRIVVYAIEGADHSLGTGMSPAVEAAVEPVTRSIEDEITRHRDTSARG